MTTRKKAVPVPAVEGPVELVVLSVKQKAARCRLLGADQSFTFRAGRLWELVPGEIAVVKRAKQWTYAGNPYLSGVIEATRLDAKALGLIPLGLKERGIWNPAEEYWGEQGEPIEAWARPIIARGPRPQFEMEQVLPGPDLDDPFPEASLRTAIWNFVEHYHTERNHQGLSNRIIRPEAGHFGASGAIQRRQRLGGTLNYYYRAAA